MNNMKTRKIIDLSVPLREGIYSDPPMFLPKITYVGHHEGAQQLTDFFPGLKPEDLPKKEGWAVEFASLSTHAGTHMDAPYHYGSHMNNGKKALTIDQIPLEWCIGNGVKLDFSQFPDGCLITSDEIKKALQEIEYELQEGDIVLMQTAAGGKYGQTDYVNAGCGFGREATLYLVSQGIKIVGTDAWSWDAPFSFTKKKYDDTKDAGLIWEGHFAGTELPYCQIEKLNNLDLLPSTGFQVITLPVKVYKASGAWARPIAIINEG